MASEVQYTCDKVQLHERCCASPALNLQPLPSHQQPTLCAADDQTGTECQVGGQLLRPAAGPWDDDRHQISMHIVQH
jgi:hypothetical protein